jgi:large conductance mechanosensitive channel
MKKLFKEFAEFINKGNAVALAIGVIIGGAFTAIVSTINTKIISPLIGFVLGGYDLAESEALKTILKPEVLNEAGEVISPENAIYWGSLIQAVIDFLLTAIVLFAIFKVVTAIMNAAKRSAERMQELLQKQIAAEQAKEVVEEVVEEAPVEEFAEEVKVSDEVLLLTEIRDLLKSKAEENK